MPLAVAAAARLATHEALPRLPAGTSRLAARLADRDAADLDEGRRRGVGAAFERDRSAAVLLTIVEEPIDRGVHLRVRTERVERIARPLLGEAKAVHELLDRPVAGRRLVRALLDVVLFVRDAEVGAPIAFRHACILGRLAQHALVQLGVVQEVDQRGRRVALQRDLAPTVEVRVALEAVERLESVRVALVELAKQGDKRLGLLGRRQRVRKVVAAVNEEEALVPRPRARVDTGRVAEQTMVVQALEETAVDEYAL
mmetsp:Transcript_45073/g.124987  ORF Transcript_45073/g.124987 Transcript_45073/m.124987 type:complete len:256 (-) Transcript_45073:38-805(-)